MKHGATGALRSVAALLVALALLAGLQGTAANAKTQLRIGLGTEPTSIDPHYQATTPNIALSAHIFDRLVHTNERQELVPGLATSWSQVDPLTWEFRLRAGVTWHDGAPFTADDVVFTFERAVSVPDAPASFALYLKGKIVSRVDDLTVRIATAKPYALMASDLAAIAIVSRRHGAGASTADYNSGKAAIGTGPYRFAQSVLGDRIVLTVNPAYWGQRSPFETVILKHIRPGPARVAALLAGDVDVIEDVPAADIARLGAEPKVVLAQSPSHRVIFLQADQWRETTPFANGKDGSAIRNPFKNLKVRQAISMAINREALVARVMEGQATIAVQCLPDGFLGASRAIATTPYDPEGARRLLAQAGLGAGFKVTLHGPQGRYPNDSRIIEAVGKMLSRIGIETVIETMPPSTFFTRASSGADGRPEFSLFLAGWGAATGDMSSPLKSLLATYDKESGLGASNRGRYSSPAFDEALEEALVATDLERARSGLARASEIAMADLGLIPLLHPMNTWAARRGLAVAARTDEATTAMSVSVVP